MRVVGLVSAAKSLLGTKRSNSLKKPALVVHAVQAGRAGADGGDVGESGFEDKVIRTEVVTNRMLEDWTAYADRQWAVGVRAV